MATVDLKMLPISSHFNNKLALDITFCKNILNLSSMETNHLQVHGPPAEDYSSLTQMVAGWQWTRQVEVECSVEIMALV